MYLCVSRKAEDCLHEFQRVSAKNDQTFQDQCDHYSRYTTSYFLHSATLFSTPSKRRDPPPPAPISGKKFWLHARFLPVLLGTNAGSFYPRLLNASSQQCTCHTGYTPWPVTEAFLSVIYTLTGPLSFSPVDISNYHQSPSRPVTSNVCGRTPLASWRYSILAR